MRIAVNSIVMLVLGCPFGAVAQPRNVAPEQWQAMDKSMTDLLLEGYRPVSVIAPSPQRRIYFLSSGSFLAKCTEESTLTRPPPPPAQLQPSAQQPASIPMPASSQQAGQFPPAGQRAASAGPGNFMPELEVTFECSRLAKSR